MTVLVARSTKSTKGTKLFEARADVVALRGIRAWTPGTSGGGPSPCVRMSLTTSSIIFAPLLSKHRLRIWFEWYIRKPRFFPASVRREIELANIKRIWTWQPELSGWPMLEIGSSGWDNVYFHLLEGTYPRLQLAPIEDVRGHVAAVEEAWRRGRPPEDSARA